MNNIFNFPGSYPNGTPIIFEDIVNDVSKTKLLVLYSDQVALKAREYITEMVAANPGNFVSIVFLFVQTPSVILDDLKKLTSNIPDQAHALNWALYDSYRMFSISPHKIISDVITVTQLDGEYGSVREALENAFANG